MVMDMSDGGSYLTCTLLSGDLIKVTHKSKNPAGYMARNILHSSVIQENKLNSTLHYRCKVEGRTTNKKVKKIIKSEEKAEKRFQVFALP